MDKAEDQVSLLTEENESLDLSRRPRKTKCQQLYPVFIHTLLFAFFSTTVVLSHKLQKLSAVQPKLYSPANDIIKYETKAFYDNIFEISPYQGTPTDEKDRLWHELYADTHNTAISAADAARLPNRTVLLAETGRSTGVVSLEVFHQLHCLDAVRQTLYPERFPAQAVHYPNATVNAERLRHHEHCVDRIRQGIQCASDVGTIFWQWQEQLKAWRISMKTTHSCRNFDDIRKWAVARETPNWDFSSRPPE